MSVMGNSEGCLPDLQLHFLIATLFFMSSWYSMRFMQTGHAEPMKCICVVGTLK
jgi:hypothetical protein